MELTSLLTNDLPLWLAAAGGTVGNSDDRTRSLMSAVGWILLILTVSVVTIVVALWVKGKWFGHPQRQDYGEGLAGGFTVGDLRRMRDAGELSDEEFERARERIVVAAKRQVETETRAAGNPDAPRPDAPQTKDVDLIREAEG